MHVSLKTLRRAMCLLDELEEVDPAEAPQAILPGLAELVGSDAATYNEFDAQNRLDYYTDYPAGSHDPALWPTFNEHAHEHPLITHFSNGKNAQEPAKISDFVSHQQFHDTGLYSEVFRVLPAEDQISFTVPPGDRKFIAISLNRASRDFTEADRDLLSATMGPIGSAFRRGRERQQARTAVATANEQLTEREHQILALAAEGRTSVAIAHAIDASPRTVSKHLEHAYRKLGVSNRSAAVHMLR